MADKIWKDFAGNKTFDDAFAYFAEQDNINAIKILLNSSKDKITSKSVDRALRGAAEKNHIEIVRLLIDYGIKRGKLTPYTVSKALKKHAKHESVEKLLSTVLRINYLFDKLAKNLEFNEIEIFKNSAMFPLLFPETVYRVFSEAKYGKIVLPRFGENRTPVLTNGKIRKKIVTLLTNHPYIQNIDPFFIEAFKRRLN